MSDWAESEPYGDSKTSLTGGRSFAYCAPDSAGSDWAAGLGDVAEGIGDLSDVPQAYLLEVIELIRSLPQDDEDPGCMDHLRTWILSLGRLAGFSKEATLRLFRAIARLLDAPRPKGHPNVPSRISLQQGFVRMQGVRETINVLLLRLGDAEVVAAACRLLAAAVQGSPLTVDFLLDDKPDNIRLLLRAIERHQADLDVAEAGCLLIAHLCAEPPVPGSPAASTRTKPHRNCQNTLSREGGAIDLLVNILAINVDAVKVESDKTEHLHKHATQVSNSMALPKHGEAKVSSSVARAKNNIEVRQAWEDLHKVEITGARVQAAALQAMLLLSCGNAETTRQLAGQLWCWGKVRETEDAEGASRGHGHDRKGHGHHGRNGNSHAAHGKHPSSTSGHSPHKMNAKGRNGRVAAGGVGAPSAPSEENSPLATLEAFAKTGKLLVEVLKGRASKDRPALAAQACRVLKVLVERGMNMLEQIEGGRSAHFAELFVKLRPGPIPSDSCKPQAPFAPLQTLVSSLVRAVRIHNADATLLSEAMALLMKLKNYALLAAPAGVERGSDGLLYEWQQLVGETQEKDELASACKVLQGALDSTDIGNVRLQHTGGSPDDLLGDAIWLTPRMREFVAETVQQGREIAGDGLAWIWKHEEPGRKQRNRQRPASPQTPTLETAGHGKGRRAGGSPNARLGAKRTLAGAAVQATTKNTSTPSTPMKSDGKATPSTPMKRGEKVPQRTLAGVAVKATAKNTSIPSTPMKSDGKATPESSTKSPSRGESPIMRGRRGSTKIQENFVQTLSKLESTATATPEKEKSSREKKKQKQEDEKKKPEPEEPPEWHRAIGYDTHDLDDFNYMWREPLMDAFQRSVSMPSLRQQRLRAEREARLSDNLGGSLGSDGHISDRPGCNPQDDVDVQFVSSEPGILRTRCIIRTYDPHHQTVSDLRVKSLMDVNVSGAEVAPLVSKHMRQQGHILPEYGVQVVFKRGRRDSGGPSALATTGSLIASPSKSFGSESP